MMRKVFAAANLERQGVAGYPRCMSTENYTPYKNLPPLAGLATFDEARTPGLSVDESVARLKRFHHVLRRLHGIFLARLTAEPIYELKMAFSLHGHICAEHTTALRARIGEMREPPLGLDVVPDANLEILLDEIRTAPDTAALLLGLYEKAIPALIAAMERYRTAVNPLADAPSRRALRFALLELADMSSYGTRAVAQLTIPQDRARLAEWLSLLDRALAAAGGLDGSAEISPMPIARHFSAQPYSYDRVPIAMRGSPIPIIWA